MPTPRPFALAALVCLAPGALACAKGAPGTGPGRGDGSILRSDGSVQPPDGGVRTDGMTGRDTGRPGSDSGGMCMDEGSSPSCAMATDLGTLEPGAAAIRRTGVIPVTGGEDWLKVGFPYHGTDELMEGGGMPRIHFSVNEGGFLFEVRARCSAAMACGGTGAASRDLEEWDFTDADDTGESMFMTRNVEWPVDIFIRVYRSGGAGDCSGYELTIER